MSEAYSLRLRRFILVKSNAKGKLNPILLLFAIVIGATFPFVLNHIVVEFGSLSKKEPPDNYVFTNEFYPLEIERIIKSEFPLDNDLIIVFSDGSNAVINKEISDTTEGGTVFAKFISKNNKFRTYLCAYENESNCEEVLHFKYARLDVLTKQQGFIQGYREPLIINKSKIKKQ